MSLVATLRADAKKIIKASVPDPMYVNEFGEEEAKKLAQKAVCRVKKEATNLLNTMADLLEDEEYGGAMLRLLTNIKQGNDAAFALTCKQTYMISIRPDDSKAYFPDFKEKVESFLTRKCFLSYKYSFEQKGTKPEDMGKGFHVHIVANMKQRSKSEVLRDTLSSWKDWIEGGLITANNIHVCITKNGEELVQKYLIEYESDDGHKAATKDYDHQWREAVGLYNLYVSE